MLTQTGSLVAWWWWLGSLRCVIPVSLMVPLLLLKLGESQALVEITQFTSDLNLLLGSAALLLTIKNGQLR